MIEKDKYKVKLGFIEIAIIVISFLLVGFSFFAPNLFIKESYFNIDFSKTGQIGDTVGGIMNPFIAIAGVLLTFLAFYIQYKANRLQRDLFRDELNEQGEQFRKTQFENQFYEMLRLHKENVNEIEIKTVHLLKGNHKHDEIIEESIKGRNVFNILLKEIELCYNIAKIHFPDENYKVWFNEAYGIFFLGLNNELLKKHEFFKDLKEIKDTHANNSYSYLTNIIKGKYDFEWEYELNYSLFDGYSSQLAHYYRHLFQTVKFIVYQNDTLISYEEKRKYLRILRAQLSNQEQALLFYNWLSDFGKQWENENNKFFTDYRLIHNLYNELLINDIKLEVLFDLNGSYLKEKNRKDDSLFEFQDWG